MVYRVKANSELFDKCQAFEEELGLPPFIAKAQNPQKQTIKLRSSFTGIGISKK